MVAIIFYDGLQLQIISTNQNAHRILSSKIKDIKAFTFKLEKSISLLFVGLPRRLLSATMQSVNKNVSFEFSRFKPAAS